MFTRNFLAAVLLASSSFVAALPAKAAQQEVAAPHAAAHSYTISSPDGSCGGETPYTCLGSAFGNCCSVYGFCGSTESFCSSPSCFSGAGLCTGPASDSKKAEAKGKDKVVLDKADVKADAPVVASATETPPQVPVHTPWRPTPFHEHRSKPSYIIDNGERAPNQVWD